MNGGLLLASMRGFQGMVGQIHLLLLNASYKGSECGTSSKMKLNEKEM